MSAFLFFSILDVFLPGSLEFLPLTCRYVVQRSFKYLMHYLDIWCSPLCFSSILLSYFQFLATQAISKFFFFFLTLAKKDCSLLLVSSYQLLHRQIMLSGSKANKSNITQYVVSLRIIFFNFYLFSLISVAFKQNFHYSL